MVNKQKGCQSCTCMQEQAAGLAMLTVRLQPRSIAGHQASKDGSPQRELILVLRQAWDHGTAPRLLQALRQRIRGVQHCR